MITCELEMNFSLSLFLSMPGTFLQLICLAYLSRTVLFVQNLVEIFKLNFDVHFSLVSHETSTYKIT